MELSRRSFLKLTGAGAGTALLVSLSKGTPAFAAKSYPLKKVAQEKTTICCYCSLGCGAIVRIYEDGSLQVHGDPDHPINEGTLCPKGLALAQISQVDGEPNVPYRLSKPLYRAPGATQWEEKSWDWMLTEIAKRAKKTRDESFETVVGGKTVNRTEAIAHMGGGELDNEECYALAKFNRAFGVVYLEHCARL